VATLHVVDVGHGNCAVAVGDGWSLMVDAGASAAVVQAVAHLGLERLDTIVISHRDLDHARGLVPLLSREELEIGTIYIGADAAKNPNAPETATLLAALADAKRRGRCVVSRDLDDTFTTETLSGGGVSVEVLAPTFAMAMTGPKGQSSAGTMISSNAISAVLRITLSGGMRVLLPGDMDNVTLAELLAKGTDLSADVLVFPHHGSIGTVTNERAFASEMARAVGARTVLFSAGRGVKARPTEAVLQGIFDDNPNVSIACTQLSKGCLEADVDLPDQLTHLTDLPAAGRADCRSCAGSMTLGREGCEGPDTVAHQNYIKAIAKTPMCHVVRHLEHSETS
jgi:beta-lactamase superfamily II metal-dependent hydrolase